MIEDEQGKAVSEIFEAQGEDAFRSLENEMVQRLMNENEAVIATGGGAPILEENWKAFGDSAVVWLKCGPGTIFKRLERGGGRTRPLLKNAFSAEKISGILKDREKFYGKAGFTVETDGLEPEETAEKILRLVSPKK
ncbi:MAG: hypothetical protein A3A86_04165, partial [Elusimicrobia bacterium RIFCSPLOWO2_01_FULL_60_11]